MARTLWCRSTTCSIEESEFGVMAEVWTAFWSSVAGTAESTEAEDPTETDESEPVG